MSYEEIKIENTDVLEEDDVVEKEKTEGEEGGLYEISLEKHNKDQFAALSKKKEIGVSGNQLDAHYSDGTMEDINEFIDSIDEKKEKREDNFEEIKSTNKNFIPGKIGKKIAEIKSKYFVKDEEWKKMTDAERVKFLKDKQEETNKLFIKKQN